MLKVRVIRKYKDPKTELLVGYTIQDMSNGNTMNVYKDQLKQAIKAGQVDCVNMTMTSDGRLIGKAYKEPVRPRTNTPAQPVAPQAPVEDTKNNTSELTSAPVPPVPQPTPAPAPAAPVQPDTAEWSGDASGSVPERRSRTEAS